MYGALIISDDSVFLQQAQRFITNVNREIDVSVLNDISKLRGALSDRDKIDVIVCDHDPPKMDAIAVFNELSRMNDLCPFIIMTKNPDGDVAIKAFELKMDYYVSRSNVINFYMDLASKIVLSAEKKRITDDRVLNDRRTETLLNMAKMQDREFGEILNYALNSGVKFTNSNMGYIAMYDSETEKLKMSAWSLGGPERCKMSNRQIMYDFDSTGVWGEPIRRRESIIINDYANEKKYHKNGTPDGHVPLNRLLMIPIFHNGKIMATAGVGNKAREYTEDDVKQFTLLMDGLMSIYHERMLQEENVRSERSLRDVLHSVPLGILILDKDLNTIMDNDYAKELVSSHSLCLSRDPVRIGNNELSRTISADLREFRNSDRDDMQFEHTFNIGNRDRAMKVVMAKSYGRNKALEGFTVIIDDITELVSKGKLLYNTMARINVLDSLINDDIRKSLSKMDEDIAKIPDSDGKAALKDSLKNLGHIMEFVREYHDVGVTDPQWQELSLVIDAAITVNKLEPGFLSHRTDGIKVLADPSFYNVFSGLITYSLTFGVHVTHCAVKCRLEDGELIISYSDDGTGIAIKDKADFTSGNSMDFGRGIYLAMNILRVSKFGVRENGLPGKGLSVEITVPPSYYSIDLE